MSREEKAGCEVRLELLLLSPAHLVQDDRPHERITTIGLEEPKPPDLGSIRRPKENQIRERGVSRPFDLARRVSRSGEVAQNRGSIPVASICRWHHD